MKFTLALGIAVAGALAGNPTPAPTVTEISVEAIANASAELELGFVVRGVVLEVLVRPGDVVISGQRLVRLDAAEAEADVRLSELRSNSGVEVERAKLELSMAKDELQKIQEAARRGAAADHEIRRAQQQVEIANLGVARAEQSRAEAHAEAMRARAVASRFELTAPTAGVVERVLVSEGELVDLVQVAVQLVVTDPLIIDASIPLEWFSSLAVGMPVTLEPLAIDQFPPLQGRLVSIGQVADPGSDTLSCRIEAPNPGRLPAGLRVRLALGSHERAHVAEADQPEEELRE